MKKTILAIALLIIGAKASANPTDTHVQIWNGEGQPINIELRYSGHPPKNFEHITIKPNSSELVKKNKQNNRLLHIKAYGKGAKAAINKALSPLLRVFVKRENVAEIDTWFFAHFGQQNINNTNHQTYIIQFDKKIDW